MSASPDILPPAGRDDLVCTFRVAMQLDEIVARMGQPRRSEGRGVAALFAGAPGTGKTLAARVLAGRLDRELWRADADALDPRALDALFTAAARDDAILLLGAPDTMRRTGDAAQRDWLVWRIATHPGLALVEAGVAAGIDTASIRRFDVLIEFNLPDAAMRRAIAARGFTPP